MISRVQLSTVKKQNKLNFGHGAERLAALKAGGITEDLTRLAAHDVFKLTENSPALTKPTAKQNWELAEWVLGEGKKILDKLAGLTDKPVKTLTADNYQQFITKDPNNRCFTPHIPSWEKTPMVQIKDGKVTPIMHADHKFTPDESVGELPFAELVPVSSVEPEEGLFAISSKAGQEARLEQGFDLYLGKKPE